MEGQFGAFVVVSPCMKAGSSELWLPSGCLHGAGSIGNLEPEVGLITESAFFNRGETWSCEFLGDLEIRFCLVSSVASEKRSYLSAWQLLIISNEFSLVDVDCGVDSNPINFATMLDGRFEISGSCWWLSILPEFPFLLCRSFKRKFDFGSGAEPLMEPCLPSNDSLGSSLSFMVDLYASCDILPS